MWYLVVVSSPLLCLLGELGFCVLVTAVVISQQVLLHLTVMFGCFVYLRMSFCNTVNFGCMLGSVVGCMVPVGMWRMVLPC